MLGLFVFTFTSWQRQLGNSAKPHHCHICRITSLTCVSVYTEVTREKLSKCDTSGPVYISGIRVFEKYFSVKVDMGQMGLVNRKL